MDRETKYEQKVELHQRTIDDKAAREEFLATQKKGPGEVEGVSRFLREALATHGVSMCVRTCVCVHTCVYMYECVCACVCVFFLFSCVRIASLCLPSLTAPSLCSPPLHAPTLTAPSLCSPPLHAPTLTAPS
jgi:hypothetical protein